MYSQFIVKLSCFGCAISRKSAAGLCHKMSAYMNEKIYYTYASAVWTDFKKSIPTSLSVSSADHRVILSRRSSALYFRKRTFSLKNYNYSRNEIQIIV